MAEASMAVLAALGTGDEPGSGRSGEDVLHGTVSRFPHELMAALAERFPAVVTLLIEAEDEVLTFYDVPAEHRRQIASANPLERLNKELKRRSAVVSIFPNTAATVRLSGAVLREQHEEWLVGRRSFGETSMRRLLGPTDEPVIPPVEAPAA